jgi:hypothetical protein
LKNTMKRTLYQYYSFNCWTPHWESCLRQSILLCNVQKTIAGEWNTTLWIFWLKSISFTPPKMFQ